MRSRICRAAPCPNPTTSTNGYCPLHQGVERRKAANPVYATYAWRKRRTRELREHRAVHGDTCPGFRRTPHRAPRLSLDHVTPLGMGGAVDGPTQILCPSCNTRRSNVMMPRGFRLRRAQA